MTATHIGLYYMTKHKTKDDLKSIIFLGSMGTVSLSFDEYIGIYLSSVSWEAIPGGSMYSVAKHGVLGFMRSIDPSCRSQGIRVATIHPWFANTAIVPTIARVFLAGIPLAPIERVAGAIVHAATDPDMETSGCTWLLPDDGYVCRLEREQLKEGVYGVIDARAKATVKSGSSIFFTLYRLIDYCDP